jgi:glucan phosphoethanolaminetransferase (alkaline phosphatase superfamily)
MLFATDLMDSVFNQVLADFPNYLRAKTPPFLCACALVWLARRLARPRQTRAVHVQRWAPALVVAVLFIPTEYRHVQAATPDVLYLHAMGGLLRTQLGFTDESHQLRPKQRESLPVPPLESERPVPPNVVFVILESVRYDAVCNEYSEECQRTPYSNRLVPNRVPLTQLRSLASSTAISLAVLWAGVGPHESREVLHTWPLLFDYARASGYATTFWTSQNMLFGNARLWVKDMGVSSFVSATELEPTADLDMGAREDLLADYVEAHVSELREPFLSVIQLSNGHYPYFVDPFGPQPFQPAKMSKAPENNAIFFNQYQNAIHQQDQHVARIIEAFRNRPSGARTVIVYTSDHGEAFREHNQLGHTFSVYDEEIHVPAWIDVPEGVLLDAELAELRQKRHRYLVHPDLTATILDTIGVLDEKGIDPYRSLMQGQSLLRPGYSHRALPLTNCAGVWSCAFENWGYLEGALKLEARLWDDSWHCFDLEGDPKESHSLTRGECQQLEHKALELFGRLPGADAPAANEPTTTDKDEP